MFNLVQFPGPPGPLAAYLTPDPGDGKRHPAIVWIHGGRSNHIGDMWSEQPPDNDQTAAAFRQAGLVMMLPSLRGGNENPGSQEVFYGEVDDVVAAHAYLATVSYVDPHRIYLGGHSTGGTLALLTAECTTKFRAVFALGPVSRISDYGEEFGLTEKQALRREIELRSPIKWLQDIKSPTFVMEGTIEANTGAIQEMRQASRNPQLKLLKIEGATHFSEVAPTNALLAQKIGADSGPTCKIELTETELAAPFRR